MVGDRLIVTLGEPEAAGVAPAQVDAGGHVGRPVLMQAFINAGVSAR